MCLPFFYCSLRVLLLRVDDIMQDKEIKTLVSISELRVLLLRDKAYHGFSEALICFNLRIESLVIESPPYTPLTLGSSMVSISELRVLLLRVDDIMQDKEIKTLVSISELRVLLLRDKAYHGFSEALICFNLRIESLVIESALFHAGLCTSSMFQSQN